MSSDPAASTPYRVLARKYRPRHFDELVGQDALVRTLKNAISSGRIAQAYMLTGVRGVGKTTTARIIARAINYTGPDGKAGPTTGPTDDCAVCRAIAEDRHPDVIEMDAASRTGVDDIRDIIDGVRYAPAQARYKVYIIDEVHMLSKQAFNALLKTLEEPPPHVKFIFATTEIRKVPVTILSRCQRFDLRRFDIEQLQKHLADVCGWEKVAAEPEALRMIARAAAGSARDGLSILDQAIALAQGTVSAQVVAEMLGLVDQGRIADLMGAALAAQTPEALDKLADLDRLGGDPQVILEDLLALAHALTRAKVTGQMDVLDPAARELAEKLTLPHLSRAWQILLKSLDDVARAPTPFEAAEMALIRLGYAAQLPDPARLGMGGGTNEILRSGSPFSAPASARVAEPAARRVPVGGSAATQAVAAQVEAPAPLQTIEDVVARLEETGQMILASQVAHFVHLIKLQEGRIDLRLAENAPARLPNDLGAALQGLTNRRWIISLSQEQGEPTVQQKRAMREAERLETVAAHPLVKAVLETFPGSTIEEIVDRQP